MDSYFDDWEFVVVSGRVWSCLIVSAWERRVNVRRLYTLRRSLSPTALSIGMVCWQASTHLQCWDRHAGSNIIKLQLLHLSLESTTMMGSWRSQPR